MRSKDFLSISDVTIEELEALLERAVHVKQHPEQYRQALAGQTLAMIFQKPSTRTRVSFEVGTWQLGGYALYLSGTDLQIGRGETIADTARVLSRYCNGIMARVFGHADIEELGKWATVPVINGLSDLTHPCQAAADFLTLKERRGTLAGLRLAYVGDGNNVAHSLMLAGAKLGVSVSVATPPGYGPKAEVVERAASDAKRTGARIAVEERPEDAVRGADAIYTDVWTSMGQEQEQQERRKAFAGYQVSAAMMRLANPECVFMHCLPAHRGEEVAAEVADSPQSVIFDEAENRLHAQKAIMVELMGKR
ncbi:MAG: ornithine carbamoyltransferase [Deltaproteobacteria bacterium]|nr:ornithine carbamoyltransferase [Deltaproteobacteria bacterium]